MAAERRWMVVLLLVVGCDADGRCDRGELEHHAERKLGLELGQLQHALNTELGDSMQCVMEALRDRTAGEPVEPACP